MLLKIFTSSIKVENIVESARMSVKVELVLFKRVGVAQLQNLKTYYQRKIELKRNTLVYLRWLDSQGKKTTYSEIPITKTWVQHLCSKIPITKNKIPTWDGWVAWESRPSLDPGCFSSIFHITLAVESLCI